MTPAFLSPDERTRAITTAASLASRETAAKMAEIIDRHSFADGDRICITLNVEMEFEATGGVVLPVARVVRR